VATGKDNLNIEELQIEGKRRMKSLEFILGHKICKGEIFGKK
jgi:methionyl-tRNA formyltransferase